VNKLDAVLDTSAIVCLLEDEPGADLVEQKIFALALSNDLNRPFVARLIKSINGSFLALREG
jgi:hypothetical protein